MKTNEWSYLPPITVPTAPPARAPPATAAAVPTAPAARPPAAPRPAPINPPISPGSSFWMLFPLANALTTKRQYVLEQW